jgi:hypothetical protein
VEWSLIYVPSMSSTAEEMLFSRADVPVYTQPKKKIKYGLKVQQRQQRRSADKEHMPETTEMVTQINGKGCMATGNGCKVSEGRRC